MQLLSPQNNPLSVSYNECALYSFNIGLPLFSRSISNELSPNRIGCNMGRVVTLVGYDESCDHFSIFILPPRSSMMIVKAFLFLFYFNFLTVLGLYFV